MITIVLRILRKKVPNDNRITQKNYGIIAITVIRKELKFSDNREAIIAVKIT
jgi:hypothetical protein